jgi:hypothetical protein
LPLENLKNEKPPSGKRFKGDIKYHPSGEKNRRRFKK